MITQSVHYKLSPSYMRIFKCKLFDIDEIMDQIQTQDIQAFWLSNPLMNRCLKHLI
jgi:hypothetical protein